MERRVITTDMMEEDIRIEGSLCVPSVWMIILSGKKQRKI